MCSHRSVILALLALANLGASQTQPPGQLAAAVRDVSVGPYHEDSGHVLNRVFRAIQVATVTPVRVGLALRDEHTAPAEFFVDGWVHETREGRESDRASYGGDERQLVREGFDEDEAQQLVDDLAALGESERAYLHARPALAIYFQYDLLRMAQRLGDTKKNPKLIEHLVKAARWAALPAAAFAARKVATLTTILAATNQSSDNEAWRVGDAARFVEVERKSTRLFDASRTLLWARVWLAHPRGGEALGTFVSAAREGKRVEVPLGFEAVLAQGIVAIDELGQPRATDVVIDVRHQRLANRDALHVDNKTTSHDGVDFRVFFLERNALRLGDTSAFKEVALDSAAVFRDYGSLKKTSYRAQCTLCHRNTDTPEPQLGGFPLLRAHALPRLLDEDAQSVRTRLDLAEEQVKKLLQTLSTHASK